MTNLIATDCSSSFSDERLNDPLWSIFGAGESDDPIEVAEDKQRYLADAYLSGQE
jgi:hypothetical protein